MRKRTAKGREARGEKPEDNRKYQDNTAQDIESRICAAAGRCGGCRYLGKPYGEQLDDKYRQMKKLLGDFAAVEPVIGMENPEYYRNKVHHVFGRDRRGNILAGIYEKDSHRVVDVQKCMLEDEKSQEIIGTVKGLLKSFKITVYDEDRDFGLLRHVLVRRGFKSGEIMVVLVVTSPVFPSKNNFVKALRKVHPGITTVVLNVNDRQTSMVLGDRNITLYGPGFIMDELCGCRFRISPDSFYQVNPVQTEVLYETAMEYADLRGGETVIDAYCGIGTIGMTAAKRMNDTGEVIGVELNRDAVRDAVMNAKLNGMKNIRFVQGDAGKFMTEYAEKQAGTDRSSGGAAGMPLLSGERPAAVDVVFMDPPRSGSTEEFMDAVCRLDPKKVVYISCGPDTLARDLKYLTSKGYKVQKIQPVDMFAFTEHVETCVLLSRK